MRYDFLFFDLDRTLWDFDRNNEEALGACFLAHGLEERLLQPFAVFFSRYKQINQLLWEAYGKGEIKKELLHVHRFHLVFSEFGVDDRALASRFADAYLSEVPLHSHLMPHVRALLDALRCQVKMYIITNGFRDVQYAKLSGGGLMPYFEEIFISEEIGVHKPDVLFFERVLARSGALRERSLIIGDDMKTDILGGSQSGIATVLYNRCHEVDGLFPDYEIEDLMELLPIIT